MIRDGKPAAVIVPIDDYEAMLEQLEQKDDLAALRAMTAEDWQTTSIPTYLRESGDRVSD